MTSNRFVLRVLNEFKKKIDGDFQVFGERVEKVEKDLSNISEDVSKLKKRLGNNLISKETKSPTNLKEEIKGQDLNKGVKRKADEESKIEPPPKIVKTNPTPKRRRKRRASLKCGEKECICSSCFRLLLEARSRGVHKRRRLRKGSPWRNRRKKSRKCK